MDATYLEVYSIAVTVKVAQALSVNEIVTWDLDVKYPCSTVDYITISGNAPETQSYSLFTQSLEDPLTFTHDQFTIALQGSDDSTLCGDLSYTATMDGTPLTEFSLPPVAYDGMTQEFQVFTEDTDFEGVKTLAVLGYLTDYTMNAHDISF